MDGENCGNRTRRCHGKCRIISCSCPFKRHIRNLVDLITFSGKLIGGGDDNRSSL